MRKHTRHAYHPGGSPAPPRNARASFFELHAGQAPFLIKHPFHLQEWLVNGGYSELVSDKHFLDNEQSDSATLRKTTHGICDQGQNYSFQAKTVILKNYYLPP